MHTVREMILDVFYYFTDGSRGDWRSLNWKWPLLPCTLRTHCKVLLRSKYNISSYFIKVSTKGVSSFRTITNTNYNTGWKGRFNIYKGRFPDLVSTVKYQGWASGKIRLTHLRQDGSQGQRFRLAKYMETYVYTRNEGRFYQRHNSFLLFLYV